MSRLDDELRKALRREQPPDDFTARLLNRVARQPEPRARWWQRLAILLDPPKLRWVAIGVTASLLLAIGAAQYRRLNQPAVSDDGKLATSGASAPNAKSAEPPTVTKEEKAAEQNATTSSGVSKPSINRSSRPAHQRGNQRHELARTREERALRTEGEAAKETLMLALSIASSALSDAQKAVHDDGLKP